MRDNFPCAPSPGLLFLFLFLAEPYVWVWCLRIFLPDTSTHCAVTFPALPLTYETLHLYVCSHTVRLIYLYRPTTSGARRLAVLQPCWLVQRAVVQVATPKITSVHSGNLLCDFDETFETFRLTIFEASCV